MAVHKWAIGKVFLSHSSLDKPFVRRLGGRIKKAGFDVWLDELELLPGDYIAARLAKAIENCRVIIVVISEASLTSKWMRYELNLATERMVKGLCRVVPVLKDAIEPPPEIKGIAYADFRKDPRKGFHTVVAALEQEAVVTRQSQGFWAQIDEILEEVFDFTGSQSVGREYSSRDIEFAGLNATADSEDDIYVPYETVSAYSDPAAVLSDLWWQEYIESMKQIDFDYFLVVSERPIGFSWSKPNNRLNAHVDRWEWQGRNFVNSVVVVLDMSSLESRDARVALAREAKSKIQEFVEQKRRNAETK